jgi:hypothetical protein
MLNNCTFVKKNMRKIALLILCIVSLSGTIQAQNKIKLSSGRDSTRSVKQDLLLLNFNWNGWMNQPQGVDVSPFSRGFEVKVMGDFPLGKLPISIGAGLGLSVENIFANAFLKKAEGIDSLYFQPITGVINPEGGVSDRDWSRYKWVSTLLELPLEIRFRANRRKRNTFKAALGFKVGYVIDSHEKYVGPDYRPGSDGTLSQLNNTLEQVTYSLPGINRLRYAGYLRLGYDRFAITAQYGLGYYFNTAWHAGNVTPISLGLTIIPF